MAIKGMFKYSVLVGLLFGSVLYIPAAQAGTLYVPTDYSTIQDAVDHAHQGDIIVLLPGTYTESVTIPAGVDLVIQGSGRDTVTWSAPADHSSRMSCIDLDLSGYTGTTRLEICGCTFSVKDTLTNTNGIAILVNKARDGPLFLKIHDNTFIESATVPDETANSMLLCHNRYAGRSPSGEGPVKIYHNYDYTTGGIVMSNARSFDIYKNMFSGGSDALYIGYGCPTNTTIGDHHIHHNVFMNASNGYPGGPWPSIFFSYYGSGTGMTFLPSTIEYNTFKNNDLAIGYSMESDISYPADVIQKNSFCSSTEYGVKVFGTFTTHIDARYNCWCHWTGPGGGAVDPITGMVASGLGDHVSAHVLFDPWLPCGLTHSPESPSRYAEQLCSLGNYNITTATDLAGTAQDLLEQAQSMDMDTKKAEELIARALELLEKAQSFCENSQNCIAGNTLALEAQALLQQAIAILESLLN